MSRKRFLGAAAVALAAIASAPPLDAEQDVVQNPKLAEALFREGRALLARGEIDAACDKLELSQKYDPSGGTLMNMADCHEKQGKTASAFAEFRAAEKDSKTRGLAARAAEAKRRAALLEPMLSRLTISAHPLPGLEVRRNDQLLAPDQLGVALPVDPGSYRVTATAPGYEPAAIEISVGARADAQTVTIPELKLETAAAPPLSSPEPLAPPEPAPVPQSSSVLLLDTAPGQEHPPSAVRMTDADGFSKATLGWVAAGSGVALAGAGGVFYLLALSADEQAESACPSHYGCGEGAIAASEQRDTYATLATIGGVAGALGIGVGAWLLLTAPAGENRGPAALSGRAPKVLPAFGPRATSLHVHGVFP